jgi:acyltransferase
MVLGHTLDAVLSHSARSGYWVQRYWELRGITAPLFLLVAGWAVVAALGMHPDAARSSFGKRIRRGLLLLFLGYFLMWPGWSAVLDMGWGEPLLARLFAFDALPCIGLSLMVGAAALTLAPGTKGRAVVLAALAIGIPLLSATVWGLAEHAPVIVRNALGSPTTKFPLFPWAGFFFAGALAAHLMRQLLPGWPQSLAIAASGLALLLITSFVTPDWAPTSAWLVAYRVGQGLLVLGGLCLLPRTVSRRLSPLGRNSLWVYVLHIPVVYGWAGIAGLAERVGQTLSLSAGLGVGLLLLLGSYAVVRIVQGVKRRLFSFRPGAPSLPPSGVNAAARMSRAGL